MQKKPAPFRLRYFGCLLAAPVMLVLIGCQGITSASKQAGGTGAGAGQLVVNPTTMNFGNVAVGGNSVLQGNLTAGSSDVVVASAAWNGQGYSVSGISFPVTVPAGQSVPFSVTFAPETTGSIPGSIAFDSNATNSPTTVTLAGTGTQKSTHTVALSWNPSTSQVIGYNVYRRLGSTGFYAKLNTSIESTTSFTDTSVQTGQTYDYVTTSVDSNNIESAYSNEATAAIPQ